MVSQSLAHNKMPHVLVTPVTELIIITIIMIILTGWLCVDQTR